MQQTINGGTDQFKQSFREEGREVLSDLETALLELNESREDSELVARVFRGLHTLKGSGAMFGFDALAGFTHNLENAFDAVRNGKLAVSTELIDLTLNALDLMRTLLEEGMGGPPADAAACAQILQSLCVLTNCGSEATATEEPAEAKAVAAEMTAGPLREWNIRFAPGPEMLLNGADPLLLLQELRALGGLAVHADMRSVPPLSEMDPERCYVAWNLVLSTGAGENAIRDVFIFVEDSCELTIEPLVAIAAEAAGSLPETDAAVEAPGGPLSDPRRPGTGGRRSYDKPDSATSLRVPAVKLDQFVDLVGELVTVQARLSAVASTREDDLDLAEVSEEVERLTSALRENSMNIRMMPIRATFEKFRRLVHDLARDLGKEVELTIEGAETELDKTVIEQLGDPLMHLIRNSMDHGIESPETRSAAGKRPLATIHLAARHSGANVLIEVSDDGAGIDADAVRRRAVEKGLIPADAMLSEQETFALLFEPGFSTAAQVTDISGRGVGMDVVRRNVESLRGSIDVASKRGEGTRVTLRLPLTLAIIDGLLVDVGGRNYVLPLGNTLECIELSREDVERANGKHLVNVRGEVIPYIRLREYFGIRGERLALEQIMVVETEDGRYGFVVDQVLGDCQTVIKNLGRFYRHVTVISGATILGNGTVALILDPERLVQEAVKVSGERPRGHPATIRRHAAEPAQAGSSENSNRRTPLSGAGMQQEQKG